jgi:prepilin-type processing-associated H-X9-DG protein/prepilin-type N-terminal cleavage/methylation domain-containing protein
MDILPSNTSLPPRPFCSRPTGFNPGKRFPDEVAAFTLIELLTVISILVILASLLFAALPKQMENARNAQCQSNLRQIGAAVFAYAAENQGALPINTDRGLWVNQLWPYAMPDTQPPAITPSDRIPPEYLGTIFSCPQAARDSPPRVRDYAFNQRLGDGDSKTADRLAALSRPSQHALVADAKNGSWLSASIFAPRHNGMVNVVFADGHVARIQLTEEITKNYNGIFWGRQSQSHLW